MRKRKGEKARARQKEGETTYERMVTAKERQDAGEEGEGTIGGKSSRPRKGGRGSERERRDSTI